MSLLIVFPPIRYTDLTEINNDYFAPFNRLCQAPAYLLRGSLLKVIDHCLTSEIPYLTATLGVFTYQRLFNTKKHCMKMLPNASINVQRSITMALM